MNDSKRDQLQEIAARRLRDVVTTIDNVSGLAPARLAVSEISTYVLTRLDARLHNLIGRVRRLEENVQDQEEAISGLNDHVVELGRLHSSSVLRTEAPAKLPIRAELDAFEDQGPYQYRILGEDGEWREWRPVPEDRAPVVGWTSNPGAPGKSVWTYLYRERQAGAQTPVILQSDHEKIVARLEQRVDAVDKAAQGQAMNAQHHHDRAEEALAEVERLRGELEKACATIQQEAQRADAAVLERDRDKLDKMENWPGWHVANMAFRSPGEVRDMLRARWEPFVHNLLREKGEARRETEEAREARRQFQELYQENVDKLALWDRQVAQLSDPKNWEFVVEERPTALRAKQSFLVAHYIGPKIEGER